MARIARQWIVFGCLMCLGGCRVMPPHVAQRFPNSNEKIEPVNVAVDEAAGSAITDIVHGGGGLEAKTDSSAENVAAVGGEIATNDQVTLVSSHAVSSQAEFFVGQSDSPCCLLDGLPSASEFLSLASDSSQPMTTPWAITSRECQCMAVRNCRVANLIDKERKLLCCLAQDFGVDEHEMAILGGALLKYRAIGERNRAAQMALEAFYNLVEVHCQRELLRESESELLRTQRAIDGVRDAGLGAAGDSALVTRRRFEIERKSAELEFNETQLIRQLKLLLAIDADCRPEPIRPICESTLPMTLIDLHTATTYAKTNRAEVRAHEMLLGSLDESDLPVARFSLQGADPTLGTNFLAETSAPGIFGDLSRRNSGTPEYSFRYDQLQELNLTTQEAIETEVAVAYHDIRNCLKQVGIARRAASHADSQLSKIEASREAGNDSVSFEDLVEARMTRLQATSTLIHDVIAYVKSQVRYRGVQGSLVYDCLNSCSCQHCQRVN